MQANTLKASLAAGLCGFFIATGMQSLAQRGAMQQHGGSMMAMEKGAQAIHDQMMSSCKTMMDHMPMEKDTDRMFAKTMAEHHKSAIDMAAIELKHGNDPILRAMAKTMAAAQKMEIDQLLARARKAK